MAHDFDSIGLTFGHEGGGKRGDGPYHERGIHHLTSPEKEEVEVPHSRYDWIPCLVEVDKCSTV